MRHAWKLIAVMLVLGMAGFVTPAKAVNRARGPKNGLEGTIATVGDYGFTFSTADGKTMKIACDANTKFTSGDAKDIKVGAKVGVIGGLVAPDQIHATEVKILGGDSKDSKTKKGST